jgi:hypothetical protein
MVTTTILADLIVLYLKRKVLTFLLLNTLMSDQSLTNVYIQYTFNLSTINAHLFSIMPKRHGGPGCSFTHTEPKRQVEVITDVRNSSW